MLPVRMASKGKGGQTGTLAALFKLRHYPKTPPAVLQKLRAAVNAIARTKSFQDTLQRIGSPLEFLDADDFARFLQEDSERNMAVVRKLGKLESRVRQAQSEVVAFCQPRRQYSHATQIMLAARRD
jgi:hypothetical protein